MFKRNSIFVKVLLPVVAVMLIQNLLIGLVLFANGTMGALEDSAIVALQKNGENRAITLESMMVHNWSNIEKLENDFTLGIGEYLRQKGISIDEVLNGYAHKNELLSDLSGALLSTLRMSASTGVYACFLNGDDLATYGDGEQKFNGLYYRDLDPISTPADDSDIIFLRGFIDIARKDKIQLDSLWSEVFTFTPDHAEGWNGFMKPMQAALENLKLASVDQSYWNTPHFVSAQSGLDANECITYTRPLFYDGRLIGMIGTEMQVDQLKKYFPANDFDSSGMGGYMLVTYDAQNQSNSTIDANVYAVTGSYVKRLFGKPNVTLTASPGSSIYTVANSDFEKVHVSLQPLTLYNTSSPFSHEQWALAAIGTDSMLFDSLRSIQTGILYGSAIALLIGSVLLAFIIRFSTRPLIQIVQQIEQSDPDDPIVLTKSNTHEIVLLCATINAMKDKRKHIEAALREERERYLITLESVADTFMEYDVAQDSFMLYYFSTEHEQSVLLSNVTPAFMEKIGNGEVCHPEDAPSLVRFLSGQTTQPIEVRVRANLFSHIHDAPRDGDCHWFLFKASYIYDDDHNIQKVIGIAREITGEKLKEHALIEATRRDLTTKLYNPDYGVRLIKNHIHSAQASGDAFSICVLYVDDFDLFEAHYGRIFSAAILRELSMALRSIETQADIMVRIENDKFLIFFAGAGKEAVSAKIQSLQRTLQALYVGENADLRLSVSAGVALSSDGAAPDDLLKQAYQASQYAAKTGKGGIQHYRELPSSVQKEKVVYRDKPVSVSIDISKEAIVSFVFDVFERTSDTPSVINLLLGILGKMFALHQLIICAYDADFGSNQVLYQWNDCEVAPYPGNIEQIEPDDLTALTRLLDENSTLLYDAQTIRDCTDGVRRLLCASPDEQVSGFGCAMYENGVHKGMLLFKSKDEVRVWNDAELYSLYEITKTISAHINIERSNNASKAKSEFLSRMSHEIRTPMNAIIGMTDIAKNSVDNPERLQDCLKKIDFSSKHLLALINDVLDMSRIESGKLKIESAQFSLAVFVDTLNTLLRPQIERKNLSFEINLHSKHIHVIGDEYRLRQVLVNLISNATKFTNAGGKISLTVEELDQDDQSGLYKFSVKDSGIGISKEDQPTIFRAFEQAQSKKSAPARHDGTGLGLAISSNIINAMGAKIELVSETGMGSEFFFTLKLKYGDGEAETDESFDQNDVDQKDQLVGKKVLLVEDNEINLEIASYILDEAGLIVEVARDGQEAVDKFFKSSLGYYDAILMDIQMPIMDGLTATREIRKNTLRTDARTVPIIAMTANAFDADMKKSIESGMNGHVAKPIEHDKLFASLRHLIGNQS